jgi:hypothetical protein
MNSRDSESANDKCFEMYPMFYRRNNAAVELPLKYERQPPAYDGCEKGANRGKEKRDSRFNELKLGREVRKNVARAEASFVRISRGGSNSRVPHPRLVLAIAGD